MTYNKATAVYADIESIRATPLTGNTRSIENPGKIFIGDAFLLVGEENQGIHVFDNSNPNSPVSVSFIQLPYTKEFFVEDNFIYAESHYDFVKIDLTDIYAPTLVDRAEYVFGDGLFNEEGEALVGFNFTVATETFKLNSPEMEALSESSYLYYDYLDNMIPAATVPSSFAGNSDEIKGTLNKIASNDEYLYVVGDRQIYTFLNNGFLSRVNKQQVSFGMETVYAEGDRLFIGTRSSMVVMSLTNPAVPQRISEYVHPTSCDPVYPFGDVAYLTLRTGDLGGCAGDQNTLDVLDISNISNPTLLHSIVMESPYGMRMIDQYLFVGEGDNGLSVFDATDPRNPVLVTHSADVQAFDIMQHPTANDVLLITDQGGLMQYQVNYSTMSFSELSSINY